MEENTQDNDYEYYSRKKQRAPKKKRFSIKFFLFLVVLALALLGILASPIFVVKDIIVTGNLYKYTSQEISTMANVDKSTNIFTITNWNLPDELKGNPYIESVRVKKELPSTVYIEIVERQVRGYVPYMGSYLYIDESGRILEVADYFTQALPIVQGLEFKSFQLGEKINADNTEVLDVVVVVSQIMTKYELLDMVVTLDVSNLERITARVNKVDINLGTISDCDEKIRTMAAIVREIHKDDRGTLDLSDLSKPLVFKYLT